MSERLWGSELLGRMVGPHPRITNVDERLGARLFSILMLVHLIAVALLLPVVNIIWIHETGDSIWNDSDAKVIMVGMVFILVSFVLLRLGYYRTGLLCYIFITIAVSVVAPFVPDPNAEIGLLATAIIPILLSAIVFSYRWVLGIMFATLGTSVIQLLLASMAPRQKSTGFALLIAVAVTGCLILVFRHHLGVLERLRLTQICEGADALRDSEERFRSLSNASLEGIMLHDQGVILDANLAFARLFGYDKPEELIGKDGLGLLLTPESGARIRERMQRQESGPLEVTGIRKDGSTFTAETDSQALKYKDRDARIASCRDISERKRAEETIKRSEERMRLFFERQVVGMAITSPEKGWLQVNDRLCKMLGYSREEFVRLTWTELTYPEDLAPDIAQFDRLLAGDINDYSLEKRFVHKDGKLVHTKLAVACVRCPDGSVDYVLALLEDLTGRKLAEAALRESDARYRAFIANTSEGIYRYEAEQPISTTLPLEEQIEQMFRFGYLAECNDAMARMYGFESAEELAGRRLADMLGADPRNLELLRAFIRAGYRLANAESFGLDRWGKMRYFEVSFISVIENGYLVRAWGVQRDITERKRAEEESEILAAIVKYSSELVNLATLDGQMVFLNEAGQKMLGIDPGGVERANIMEVIPDHLKEKTQKEVVTALRQGKTWKGELQYLNLKTMDLTDVHAMTFTIKDPNTGEPLFLANVSLDISERKRAEEALRESEERFRQIAENIQEIFFLYEKEGDKLLYVSPVISSIFGVSAEMLHADRTLVSRAVHPDDLSRVDFIHPERLYSRPLNEEFRIQRPADGAMRWMRMRSFLIRDEQGEVVRVAGLAADVTDFKNAQEKTRQQQLQLIQADKMASLGLLVSGIAHEINNPNNYISLSLPLLRKAWENLGPFIKEYQARHADLYIGSIPLSEFMDSLKKLMDGIEDGSRRIKGIIADLKEYARQESTNIQKEIDLNLVVESALNLVMPVIKKQTRCFSFEPAAPPLRVCGNRQRLEQVVINLLQNACDALTDNQQAVRVRCEEREGKAAIIVQDGGCGIAPENLLKIYDPFFTTKHDKGGTGLGLSVSSGIVREHNGQMLFQSEPGKGTTVTLLFNRSTA